MSNYGCAADSVTLSLDGGSGDDFIRGAISIPSGTGSHGESLTGDGGNDHLIARGDADALIWGGQGSDVLTGGGGADTFYEDYSALADGVRDTDVVTNYSMAEGDVIDLPNGIADVASWRVIDGSTRLTLVGDHDVLVLRGVSVTDLHTDVLFT